MTEYDSDGWEIPSNRTAIAGVSIAEDNDVTVFSSVSSVAGEDPMRNPRAFLSVPWFDARHYRKRALLQSYAIGGMLPGNLPMDMVVTREYGYHFIVPDTAIRRTSTETSADARCAFIRLLMQHLLRTPGRCLIPVRYNFDPFFFRTDGEVGYGSALAATQWADLEGQFEVSNDMLLSPRPLLRAEFRYLRRLTSPGTYWDMVRWERLTRSRSGFLVPYQCIEFERIRPSHRTGRYVPLCERWREVESCRGCNVELPPAITYVASCLMNNPISGLWVVVLTEWTVRFAAYVLWDVYTRYRLWYVPVLVRRFMRCVDLTDSLGGAVNRDEFLRLLDVIDSVNWASSASVPSANSNRPRRMTDDLSPSRSTEAGDWLYYDPWNGRFISASEAARLSSERHEVPQGHPIGYVVVRPEEYPFGSIPDQGGELEFDPVVDNESALVPHSTTSSSSLSPVWRVLIRAGIDVAGLSTEDDAVSAIRSRIVTDSPSPGRDMVEGDDVAVGDNTASMAVDSDIRDTTS